ncbi:hypothetical protein A0H81_15021 [Grifola frondosa]|uniref:Phosphoglycerate mutase-like protein n=1 Tax=Grifola frondosa TaxID=5627 RepID=A0A1C7LJR7_GRIFR|nr:hypothetical protein A0H81_15021 [Grifola frondosa]
MADKPVDSLNGLSSEIIATAVASSAEADSPVSGETNENINSTSAQPKRESSQWLTLTLFRHGECRNNQTTYTLAYYDDQRDVLTKKGEEQSQALGRDFANIHFDTILCSPLKRATQTAEYLLKSNDTNPAPPVRHWDLLKEQDHGPEFRSLMLRGYRDAAYELRIPRGNPRNHRPGSGESAADVEKCCIDTIWRLMMWFAREVPQSPEGLDDESKSCGLQVSIAELAGHPDCKPDTLPPGVPHVGIVSHNLFLTELVEALLSWHSESHADTSVQFQSGSWARVVLRWDPSDEKATSERSAHDIQVALPGCLDVWFLKGPSWY